MKLSFSTLGCPEWSWNEIIATAKDMGFDGIEIRGVENELYAPGMKEFSQEQIQATQSKLRDLGLDIVCLTSACYLYDSEHLDTYIEEGKAYIDLATQLNVPYVRVLGDQNPQPSETVDDNIVADALNQLCAYASGKGVTVLIETNGVYADTRRLAKLLNTVSQKQIGVLWDVHHPYRYFQETPEQTYQNVGPYIRYVHLKDSILKEDGSLQYKMMGYGDLPIKEAVKVLRKNGYDGYLSLEWVKRWYSDLEAPGVVFMQYINYMKKII